MVFQKKTWESQIQNYNRNVQSYITIAEFAQPHLFIHYTLPPSAIPIQSRLLLRTSIKPLQNISAKAMSNEDPPHERRLYHKHK